MTPIDESQPIKGLTPQEEARRQAVEEAMAEERKIKEEWSKLKDNVNQFKDRLTAQYGNKFKVFNTIDEDVPVYANGEYGRGQGIGVWKVTVGEQQVFAFPQFRGMCEQGFGEYIVLADGTVHRVESNRWGDSQLKVDARIHTVSEPNLKGERYPLLANAQDLGESIYLNNYDDSRRGNNIYGLGGMVKAGDRDVKIEYNQVNTSSSKTIEKFNQILSSTLASKQ